MPMVPKRLCAAGLVLALGVCCFAGCSPQQSSGDGQPSEGPATDTAAAAWSFDGDCAVCHTAEAATMNEGSLGAQVHSAQAQTTCTSCHVDEAALAGVHEGKTASDAMPKKLKKTDIAVETCQAAGCHDLGKDEMLALTADNDELIDSEGTQVNPHDVIGLTPGHEDITCANCHKMHKEEAKPSDVCVSCHHAGVYTCNTCH